MRVKVSENKKLVKEIREKLKENKEKYGKQFCPCALPTLYESENSNDYVCMCKEFSDQIERKEVGECHCGLYVATND